MNLSDPKESVRYWVFDTDTTPQRFPLRRLVRRVKETLGDTAAECRVLKARGYGERVCAWDALLDEKNDIPVDFTLLDDMTEGTEQWFYDLEIECSVESRRVAFGLHDSTALFVEAPKAIADAVVVGFSDVRSEPKFR
jgi:hypothetical protein